ncbi:MAG: hypothetical protein JJV98_14365 [Desulfosarcina sp.]|nr:hypothetical protein [Desulfobacterales bacterium]
MPPPLFNVMLTGQIAEGHNRRTVIAALARLFDRDVQVVANLLDAREPIVKRNVDARTGHKYLEALEQTGALGRLAPADPETARTAPESLSAPPPSAADLKERVIYPPPHPADVAFAPIQANRITGAPQGIDLNRIDTPPIAFEDIASLGIYEDHEEEKVFVLVFRRGQKRPYQCDANRVVFTDFPGTKATSVIASLRRFVGFIAQRHLSLRLDPGTAEFLKGRPPAILDIDLIKFTTTMGQALLSMATTPVP